MRKIKFRGKKDNGEWIYGILDYDESDGAYFIAPTFEEGGTQVSPKTIGQYVCDDDNKKEVYTGDILHIWCKFHNIDVKKAEVFWNEKRLEFDLKMRDERYSNYIKVLHQCHWLCEVIGNIYET